MAGFCRYKYQAAKINQRGIEMKLYERTIRCDVRLPAEANAIVENEARRTGIQKSVLMRSIILGWLEKEHNPAAGAELGGTTPVAGAQHTPNGVVADV